MKMQGTAMRTVVAMLGVAGASLVSTATAQSGNVAPQYSAPNDKPFGCACLHNQTNAQISYRYRWGTGNWQDKTLTSKYQQALCWRYAEGSRTSPPLEFQLDVDMSSATAWTTYTIERAQSVTNQCNDLAQRWHYDINYRPGTNSAYIHVTRRP